MIVNPSCMKDLDCIAACPECALRYTVSSPALLKSIKSGRFGLPYQFSLVEEFLMAFVFVVVLLSFRGLYSRIPFLLSLAMGAIAAYFSITAVRLFTRSDVSAANLTLKTCGRLTGTGQVFSAFLLVLAAFIGHCAFERFHEYTGMHQALTAKTLPPGEEGDALAASALEHLHTAKKWALLDNERVERRMIDAAAHLALTQPRYVDEVERYAKIVFDRYDYDLEVHHILGRTYMAVDRPADAERAFSRIIDAYERADKPTGKEARQLATIHQAYAELLANGGRFDEIVRYADRFPNDLEVHRIVGRTLMEAGRPEDAERTFTRIIGAYDNADAVVGQHEAWHLATIHQAYAELLANSRRFAEGESQIRRGLALVPERMPALHVALGASLASQGRSDDAIVALREAIKLAPEYGHAHYTLAASLLMQGKLDEAIEAIDRAYELQPDDQDTRDFREFLHGQVTPGAPPATGRGE